MIWLRETHEQELFADALQFTMFFRHWYVYEQYERLDSPDVQSRTGDALWYLQFLHVGPH